MRRIESRERNLVLGIMGVAVVLYGVVSIAQTPPDTYYVGGPDDYEGNFAASETWHTKSEEVGVDTTVHPWLDHGAADEFHSLLDSKFTIRRNKNDRWRLIVDESLGWTPNFIRLRNHEDWDEGGSILQWRWINRPNKAIDIDGHDHDLCIGIPDFNEPILNDDEFMIMVLDRVLDGDGEPVHPDCGDPTEVHPGHANVGR